MSQASTPIVAAIWSIALCVAASLGSGLSIVAFSLLPLPLLIAAGRGREGSAGLACLLVAAVSLLLWGPQIGILYLVVIGGPAVLLTTALLRGFRIDSSVLLAVAVFAVGSLAVWALSGATVTETRAALSGGFDQSFGQVLERYREFGVGEAQLQALEENRVEIVDAVTGMVPAIAVTVAAVLWLANVWLSSWWVTWPQLIDLSRWQVPPHAIWLFIASGFAMFTPFDALARNLFVVMLAVYFFQGAAVVSYYLGRLRLPGPLRAVVLALAVLEQVLAVFVLLLGIFDLWGDFRRLGRPQADALAGSD
jgi:hypothetical protein